MKLNSNCNEEEDASAGIESLGKTFIYQFNYRKRRASRWKERGKLDLCNLGGGITVSLKHSMILVQGKAHC